MKIIRNHIISFIEFWLPFIIWALVIFSFSANPSVKTSEIHWQDFIIKKSAHLTEYFIFTMLLYRALVNSKIKKKNAVLYSVISAFLYGATDEFHQSFTPGRDSKLRDVLIDGTGSLIFIFFLHRILPQNRILIVLSEKLKLS